MASRYVQYGCGFSAPTGWTNFDASPTLRIERVPVLGRFFKKNNRRFPENVEYGDIEAGLPVGERSCRGIYCSHVLEHLSRDSCRRAIRNTFRYLEPGGIFRLVVPDLRQLASKYLRDERAGAAHEFMLDSGLGRESPARGVAGSLRHAIGKSAHLWLWDERSMSAELEEAGFTGVRRCEFGDSEYVMFRDVEDKSRFDGCLAMEARKPL